MPSSKSSLMDDQDSWERLSNVSSTPSLLQMNYSCAASQSNAMLTANGDHSMDLNDSTYNPSLLSIKNVVDHERKTSYGAAMVPVTERLLADNGVMTATIATDDVTKTIRMIEEAATAAAAAAAATNDVTVDDLSLNRLRHKDGSVHSNSSNGSNGYRNNKPISISKQDLMSRTKFIMVENWDFDCSNNTSSDEIVGVGCCGGGGGGSAGYGDDSSFCSGSGGLAEPGLLFDECRRRSGTEAADVAGSGPAVPSASFWSQFHIISLTNVLSFLIGCSIGILMNRNGGGGFSSSGGGSGSAVVAAAAAATASTSSKSAGSASGRLVSLLLRFPKFE